MVPEGRGPTTLDSDDDCSELMLNAEVSTHESVSVIGREARRIIGTLHLDGRPLVARADTEVDAAPIRWTLISDPRGRVAISERHTGSPKCRRGRDDRPGGEFANLVHWYFPQLEPGSEQDASAHHDHVDAFGRQLVGLECRPRLHTASAGRCTHRVRA